MGRATGTASGRGLPERKLILPNKFCKQPRDPDRLSREERRTGPGDDRRFEGNGSAVGSMPRCLDYALTSASIFFEKPLVRLRSSRRFLAS